MRNFQQQKNSILDKKDKSSKKSWDKKIINLCKKINSLENFYTTSSCSGRIVLIIDNTKKSPGLFIKVWHRLINLNELKKELKKFQVPINKFVSKISIKDIKFKQEPVIIHIACENLKDALDFLKKARNIGFKRGGIISGGNRFILELIGTEKLEFPIIKNKKILVNDEFLKLIVKKSNENLKKSWERIKKLKNAL